MYLQPQPVPQSQQHYSCATPGTPVRGPPVAFCAGSPEAGEGKHAIRSVQELVNAHQGEARVQAGR
jgi:hypothetical protein